MITLRKTTLTSLLTAVTAVSLFVPTVIHAQGNTLVNIPQLSGGGFDGYINAVYAMFISIAALLAVVKVIVAGVKYMFSDVVTQKSEAKKDIQGALLGLVIVLSAVLILTVINPNLTRFDLSGVTQTPRAPAIPQATLQEQLQRITQVEPELSWIPNNSATALKAEFADACARASNVLAVATVGGIEQLRCVNRSATAAQDNAVNNMSDAELATLITTYVDPIRNNDFTNEEVANLLGVSEVYFTVNAEDLNQNVREQLILGCQKIISNAGGTYTGIGNNAGGSDRNSIVVSQGSAAAGGDQWSCVASD